MCRIEQIFCDIDDVFWFYIRTCDCKIFPLTYLNNNLLVFVLNRHKIQPGSSSTIVLTWVEIQPKI